MKLIRGLLAVFFKNLFKIGFFREKYFGFHKHIFTPYQLFREVKKKIIYRDCIYINIDLEDWIQQQIYFLGDYEKPEIDYLYQYLKPGYTFLDIGANIGLFSLNASKIVGNTGSVFSFEAFTPNFLKLKKNIEDNNLKNTVTEHRAISNDNSPVEILYRDENKNIGMASAFLQDFTSREIVEGTTVDQFLSDRKIIRVDLIKIDIEGGEFKALSGMTDTLRNLKPQIIIEISSETLKNSNSSEEELTKFLKSFDYQMIKKLSTGENSYNAVFGIN